MSKCAEFALEVLDPMCAAHVLHHFSPTEGYPAGSFFSHIVNAFAAADPHNHHRLGEAFPHYKLAFHLAKDHELGTDTLRSIVARPSGV